MGVYHVLFIHVFIWHQEIWDPVFAILHSVFVLLVVLMVEQNERECTHGSSAVDARIAAGVLHPHKGC